MQYSIGSNGSLVGLFLLSNSANNGSKALEAMIFGWLTFLRKSTSLFHLSLCFTDNEFGLTNLHFLTANQQKNTLLTGKYLMVI